MTKSHECRAALSLAGQNYPCTQMAHMAEGSVNHDGWAHSNGDADAIWISDRDPVPVTPREHIVSDTEDCWCEPEVVRVPAAHDPECTKRCCQATDGCHMS